MVFERDNLEMTEEDLAWLDCRMIAFKHNMMDSKLLYWDIVGSKQLSKEERRSVQGYLLDYMTDLEYEYPNDIMEFALPEHTIKYKGDYYKRKFWCIQGDGIIIGLTPDANPGQIVRELTYITQVDARTAIGYYTSYNDLVLPDYEMHVLDFPYFKNQMKIGKIYDSKPTDFQVEEYYRKNKAKVLRMEKVNERSLNQKNNRK